jgi:tetratricopeptide (TPR) repeat protein
MPTRERGWALVLLGILWAAPAGGWAADESALLVARGEVAYHQGRYDEALDLLTRAVAANPEDVEAQYFVGVVLFKLKRYDEAAVAFEKTLARQPGNRQVRRSLEMARTREEGDLPTLSAAVEKVAPIDTITRLRRPELLKRWDVHASVGVEYDSNVPLAAGETILVRVDPRETVDADEEDDAGFLFGAGGRYDVLSREDSLLRFEYDLFQSLHTSVTDFDFQSQRPRGTASYAIRPNLWAGVQGGYNYFRLDGSSYLGEPFAFPFVSLLLGDSGLGQVSYRYASNTYYSTPFEDVRDGNTHEVGASYTYYWGQAQFATLAYTYGLEDPYDRFTRGAVEPRGQSVCFSGGTSFFPCPQDFDHHSNEVRVSAGFPAWWKTFVDLMYLYRYDEYTERNSAAGFRKQRYDNQHRFLIQIMRPINEHLRASLGYMGTVNPSNIDLYDYDRHVVSGIVEVVY